MAFKRGRNDISQDSDPPSSPSASSSSDNCSEDNEIANNDDDDDISFFATLAEKSLPKTRTRRKKKPVSTVTDLSSPTHKRQRNVTASSKVGGNEIVVIDSMEPMGSESVIITGKRAQPSFMVKAHQSLKMRKMRNGFIKPRAENITAKKSAPERSRARCQVCMHSLNGDLAQQVGNDGAHIRVEESEKTTPGTIFLSTVKLKFTETKEWASKDEVAAHLAKIWNMQIRKAKRQIIATQSQGMSIAEESIDMLLKAMNNEAEDITKQTFNGRNNTREESKSLYPNLDDDDFENLDEVFDFSMLPPELDVDDFLYHFDVCLEDDTLTYMSNSIKSCTYIQDFIMENSLFVRKSATVIDDSDNMGGNFIPNDSAHEEQTINFAALHGYLQTMRTAREFCTEKRMTEVARRSAFVYNNLEFLKSSVPAMAGITNLHALRYTNTKKTDGGKNSNVLTSRY